MAFLFHRSKSPTQANGHEELGHPSMRRLQSCSQWLSCLSNEDVIALGNAPQYRDFLRAFDQLQQAHLLLRNTRNDDNDEMMDSSSVSGNISDRSFLQSAAADELLLRVFDFLESQSLARALMSCRRFRVIAERSARRRSAGMTERQLVGFTKLLRAREQIDGICNTIHDPHVRVPTLLLARRVIVTNSGDPDFNGVYYCTGCNQNGFIFTKARNPERRVQRTQQWANAVYPDEVLLDSTLDETHPGGKPLRCIIAKRYSNHNLLWYMSKEIHADEADDFDDDHHHVDHTAGTVSFVYSFWAKLMIISEGVSEDICRYPSQTSVLERLNENGWRALANTQTLHPPIVELFD